MFLEIHLFLLLLFMPASIVHSSSQYIDPYTLSSDSENLTCFSVFYPFGTAGTALPGFEIGCPPDDPQNSPPFLIISNNTYTIQEMSLQGYIKIFAGPIRKWCIDANGKSTESKGPGQFNLHGTPFTLSYQYNMLTVVGCNNVVLISRPDTNLTSGCVTFCDSRSSFSGGSCSGIGCCQATLPGSLKSFNLKFTQVEISILNSSRDLSNCSTAFFAQRDDFQPNKSDFVFGDLDLFDKNFNNKSLVQLDWAIGNKSCKDSWNGTGSLVCKNNSYCYDSPLRPGYLCNCIQGYDGNPYAKDGCTDIDECHESKDSPCVGTCTNLPGSYKCSCPLGMTGDGKKGGSGCKSVFRLDIALGAGLGLLTILFMSSLFSYWGLQKRKIAKNRSRFFRQNGGT